MSATVTELATKTNTLNVELTFNQIQRVVTMFDSFISNDDARPILAALHITSDDGYLRLQGTDSYRLLQIDTDIPVGDSSIDELDITVPWVWFRQAVKSIRFRAQPVLLMIDHQWVKITNVEEKWAARRVEGTYPNFNSLVPSETTAFPPLEPAGFDPEKLAPFVGAIHRGGYDKNTAVKVCQMTPLKPFIVRLTGDRSAWPGWALLMPVRLSQ